MMITALVCLVTSAGVVFIYSLILLVQKLCSNLELYMWDLFAWVNTEN